MKYRKYRPMKNVFEENAAKGRLLYAGMAVLETVRDRKRKWTWAYFAERRDDRNTYVDFYIRKLTNSISAQVC
jgi:vacuolar protein sorting-associated protein 13A/C